jgi:DNA-binding SARP family transcriptional activator
VLALGLMTTLAELMLDRSPLESIRLTQYALTIDPVWENAYRIQMHAYAAQGNRPLAIKTYRQCQQALTDELGIDPLPETQTMYEQILQSK